VACCSAAKVKNNASRAYHALNEVCLVVSVASVNYGFPVGAHVIENIHIPLLSSRFSPHQEARFQFLCN
jgi:hypothetical protein